MDALGPEEPTWAEDAEYHIPAAGVSLRGRADIDELVTGMQGNLKIRVMSMAERGPFLTGLGEAENSTPGMEFKGAIAFVCKVDDKDKVVEWWSSRA
jgi:hypothetical protein